MSSSGWLALGLVVGVAAAVQLSPPRRSNGGGGEIPNTPEATLDALHAAAARADGPAYFDLFDEAAVFLGTDPAERWEMPAFRAYAGARFAAGDGWSYTVAKRHVVPVAGGTVYCFDEALQHARLGACRSTGTLVRAVEGGWRVAQYSLSMPVPNEHILQFAEQLQAEAADDARPARRP